MGKKKNHGQTKKKNRNKKWNDPQVRRKNSAEKKEKRKGSKTDGPKRPGERKKCRGGKTSIIRGVFPRKKKQETFKVKRCPAWVKKGPQLFDGSGILNLPGVVVGGWDLVARN